ncbi:thiazole biosynthesis protein [Clostridium fermenticellae]|uniref:Thiamine thiazole synthase n=1 Tax=Clostridium fermenticellae TaxID=2068654 RepID=A0A386H609_9CLOT|nr:sulfide-dependent adenosine diphosphate thiazole synthase [Clostridium fermenticellae]AYD41177.1 thiazole biosynthesis protein [Clostridium fermenticellae]
MYLEDTKISKAIIDTYKDKLEDILYSDVIIVGGGPSGLVAAAYLAEAGVKTTIIERSLSIGGGMWGGGMMMNQIVIQESARSILDDFNVNYKKYEENYYTVDSIECVSALTLKAVKAGAKILNLISVEDVIEKDNCIAGLVINWAAVEKTKMPIDPIMIESKYILDATGHDASIVNKLVAKQGNVLNTENGSFVGEKTMWADRGEDQVVKNTGEVYPGLYVSGMAANATLGGQRMGPVFGGMLLSGQKAAKQLIEKLHAAK